MTTTSRACWSKEDFVSGLRLQRSEPQVERLGYDDSVSNGQGVWVYSRSNVVLVP